MSQFDTWRRNFQPKRFDKCPIPFEYGDTEPQRSNPMNEGNTAFQVSPFGEQVKTDATAFDPENREATRSFFEKIADTVVQASELAKTVEQMRSELDKLRQDIEAVREANYRMDQEISALRAERDQAKSELAEARRACQELSAKAQRLEQENETLRQHVHSTEQERDEHFQGRQAERSAKEQAQYSLVDLEDRAAGLVREVEHWQGLANACQNKLDTLKSIFQG